VDETNDLEEKKLIGSGGQPCNKCTREYSGSPGINYENPNETIEEGIILIEKGEYTCKTCTNILALYRRFNK
jgi:hypothetical protein